MPARAEVRERPIIFDAPMVRAVLDGRKSMTRRVVKPQPREGHEIVNEFGQWWPKYLTPLGPMIWVADGQFKCPYGVPGDRLWVRETWAPDGDGGACWFKAGVPVYDAGRRTGKWDSRDRLMGNPVPVDVRWRSPIHMPQWASRVTLEITGVRVEQIQEIGEEDAKAEGVTALRALLCSDSWHAKHLRACKGSTADYDGLDTYRGGFAFAWDVFNNRRGFGWGINPWVWVIGFRRLEASP